MNGMKVNKNPRTTRKILNDIGKRIIFFRLAFSDVSGQVNSIFFLRMVIFKQMNEAS